MEVVTLEDRFLSALQSLSSGKPSTLNGVVEEPAARDETVVPGFGEDEALEVLEIDKEDDGAEKKAAPTPINIFQHPDSHPIVLDLALLREYGPEWLLWEPEVLAWRIPQDFRTSDVSDLNMEKIQAMKTLHFVDDPWEEWQVFLWTCMAVNGFFPDFEIMQVPSAAQTVIAISIFNKVRQDVPWSDEVKDYLGIVWKADGVLCTVEPADFFTIDTEDLVVDCPKVQERWPDVRRAGAAPAGDTPEDEQLRRLLVVHDQLREDRERLDRQLSLALHG